jgi:hypothetical protein
MVLCAVSLAGCDGQQPFMVSDAEKMQLTQLRAGTHVLIDKDQLNALKSQAETGKSVGRYERFVNGFRTWRLDTATGKTCIMLTSEADWKRPETTVQGCNWLP